MVEFALLLSVARAVVLGSELGVSSWRRISITIFRKYVQDKAVQRIVDIVDLGAGHGSHTAAIVYGRELTKLQNSMYS
jgi:hypothetical protein